MAHCLAVCMVFRVVTSRSSSLTARNACLWMTPTKFTGEVNTDTKELPHASAFVECSLVFCHSASCHCPIRNVKVWWKAFENGLNVARFQGKRFRTKGLPVPTAYSAYSTMSDILKSGVDIIETRCHFSFHSLTQCHVKACNAMHAECASS